MTVIHMKAIALLLTVFISGCGVGVATVSPTECSLTESTYYEWEATGVSMENYDYNSRKPSKQHFLSGRGQPDEIITVNSVEEVWVYEQSMWCGFIVGLGFAVPLMLPVCDGVDRITFEGETVKQIERTGVMLNGLLMVDEGILTHSENCYGIYQQN